MSEVIFHSLSMSTDSVLNEDTTSTSLPADVTDDSCIFGYIEIVPLTRDTDGACTTECDSRDWSAQIKQENLPAVKQEPRDVCYVTYILLALSLLVFMIESRVILFSFIEHYQPIRLVDSNHVVLCFTSVLYMYTRLLISQTMQWPPIKCIPEVVSYTVHDSFTRQSCPSLP